MRRTVRTGTLVVLVASAGLVLAACGPDDSSSSASSSGSTTSAGSAPASNTGGVNGGAASGSGSSNSSSSGGSSGSSGSAGGAGSSGGSAPAGSTVPACTTANLTTTTGNQSSGAGHTTFQIIFQNTGSQTCRLDGFPGVSFVKAHNVELGKAAARTGAAGKGAVLIPNAHAYADVQTVNGPGGYSSAQCDLTTVPTLRVFPPNQTESTNIPWNQQECVGSSIQNLQVGPVHGNK